MGRVLATLALIGALAWGVSFGTSHFLSDPFGTTTRTEIRAKAAVEMTQLQTQAAVKIANAQANAQIESARAAAEAVEIQAQEKRKTNEIWAATIPLLLLIVISGGALWLVIVYSGRIALLVANSGIDYVAWAQWLRNMKKATSSSASDTAQRKRQFLDPEEVLDRYAAAHNQRVVKENGYHLLIDNTTNQVVKQLAIKDR